MIGQTLAHYRITAAIGAGGMGEVYRATDTKLGRDVALKVLPAEMASSPERLERFQREAKALAALDHPGIVGVFSVEEAGGIHFLTMQLVEGQSLDRVIPEQGLPLARLLEIVNALAEALGAAHEKGIVHRDLKPANVMVTKDGRVKVLDFGLAKLTGSGAQAAADSERPTEMQTREGIVMGTVPYMSPEQVQGRTLDHRTDIFSLGVILYEMATGRRPFQGHSSAELVSSILRDTPRPLGELRRDLPEGLGRVIQRCLEKTASDRFPSARDLRDGLRGVVAEPEVRTATALAPRPGAAGDSGSTRADDGFWVAVLPFKYAGTNADLTALAEGLSEEIVTGLSRFSYLRVISRSSTSRYAHQAIDIRAAGKQLGARYVMEGSLRQAGTRLRIAVQLVDTTSGAHLWAETYDRSFSPEAVFELQDDLVPRIVSTVADWYGLLPRSMSEALRGKGADQLSPYEAVLRSFGYYERSTVEEHATARTCLERAVQQAPGNADGWAMLSMMYTEEHAFGFNVQPDPLERGLQAARRAAEAAPSNPLAHHALARALFFREEFPAFRSAAERAIELNPMDGASVSHLGGLMAYAGDWDRGCALVERAAQLNPHHPGRCRFPAFYNAYRNGDYRGALSVALKINMPGFFYTQIVLAALYGQLGEREAAGNALRELLALKPDFALIGRDELEKWHRPELVEQLMDGLRKAGLAMPTQPESGTPSVAAAASPSSGSGATRADEGFWVAVLPFKYTGSNADLTALAEGVSEEIVTGLSRFSYLRVISRGSTLRYVNAAVDVRTVGKEIGARYVMEGSLRQAGSRLRVAVQLVDASSGAHLWAETYDRTFSAETVFELQDDLVPRIVSTVADWSGVLPRALSEAVRSKTADQLSPYEAVLRGCGYYQWVRPDEHAAVRASLERAVDEAPQYADAWVMLSMIYGEEHRFGFNAKPDPLGRALRAARQAVDAAPSNHLAHLALAQTLFFRKDFVAFRSTAERAIALNPMDGFTGAYIGHLMAFAGDWEHGCDVFDRARQLNPHHPAWYWALPLLDAYRRGEYHDARALVPKANMPGQYYSQALFAALFGQLGEREAAGEALREVRALRPDFAEVARDQFGKWYLPQLVEQLIDGLRKAGLEIPPPAEVTPPEQPPDDRARAAAEPSVSPARDPAAVAIAVLPFSDMSPAKDQEYLCEGMAEEIMNALVRIDGIRVASRTSAFRARRDGGDLAAIARVLSVGHVLEGSVRTAGSRLRVTAQLTDVASGYQLWSERFDREADDVFAVQDEIAAGVVEAVKSRLAPGAAPMQARPQARNLEAYRSYLKGRHLRGKEHHDGARRAFEEAVRLDPSHAPSWTGLAEITVLASVFGLIPAHDACATARRALATATRLQGESAEGLHVEAFVAWIERRWAAMEAAWRRAIELQPTHVLALASFGIALCTRQRLDEALPFLERARQADPLASFPYTLTGAALLNCGRPQEGLRYLEDALSFEKEDATALDNAGMAKVALGRLEEGIAMLEQVVALSHRGAHFLGTLGWALATAGRKGEARTLLEELRARPPTAPAVVSEAWLLGALGEVDAAFAVVARAEQECLAYLYFTGFAGFDPLRADPRFEALLARLDLPTGG